ncbi:hypothetical protein [Sphingomonas abietis]|uniref:Uncharacterized protein n=1 Tax=Sphingomonas abietis TaxID=3012344 RepID=A0ABY7NT01_9SPHN|nr:hypothetical protein [Sphingomonas abietis]WBO23566.1 hypothetical protein PBT88_05400 [Sphingomonas abietis]
MKDMTHVREWALGSDAPIAILSDLSGLSVHAQEISAIVGGGANQLRDLPLHRYAMIVPSFLMRMQVRRIDPFPQRRLFQSVPGALDWLDWADLIPSAGREHAPGTWGVPTGWGYPDGLVGGGHRHVA